MLAYDAFASCVVGVAPVVFQIVDAPRRVLQRVLIFVAETAGPSGASLRSGIGINAELQPERMNVVADGLHAMRKALRVGDDVGIGVAAHLPAVVNVDVDVARVFHARLHHGVGHALDHVFADVAGELVPRVPAHGRSEREIRRGEAAFLCDGAASGNEKNKEGREGRVSFSCRRFTRSDRRLVEGEWRISAIDFGLDVLGRARPPAVPLKLRLIKRL